MRQHLYRYVMVTIGCVLMGIAINAFYMPNKLISGGIGGVSVILYYLGGLPMGITSLLLNIPLFIAAYKFMDRTYSCGALYGMLVFAVSLDAFHFLSEKAPYVHDPMLACIAGGVIYGIGAAMMYRVGGSSGGTDIIGAIVNKHYSISIGTTGFLFNIILMFIGASPASTGGGIKTTTFFVVMLSVIATVRQRQDYNYHHRRLAEGLVKRALALATLALSLVIMDTVVISAIEYWSGGQENMVDILFEVVSAFGTVGLSTGITAGLHDVAKFMLIITMFCGRVGLLTVSMALSGGGNKASAVRYPEDRMMVG